MHAVIFEVRPFEAGYQGYLDMAAKLRPKLEATSGFVSVERFASIRRKGWLLSLSLWHSAAAIAAWRSVAEHGAAQLLGRTRLFDDYRIRVTKLVPADAGANSDDALPVPAARSGEGDSAKVVVLAESRGTDSNHIDAPRDAEDFDLFESLTSAGKRICLAGWPNKTAAMAWCARWREAWQRDTTATLSLTCVVRDYGMFDRGDAPQYYPPLERRA